MWKTVFGRWNRCFNGSLENHFIWSLQLNFGPTFHANLRPTYLFSLMVCLWCGCTPGSRQRSRRWISSTPVSRSSSWSPRWDWSIRRRWQCSELLGGDGDEEDLRSVWLSWYDFPHCTRRESVTRLRTDLWSFHFFSLSTPNEKLLGRIVKDKVKDLLSINNILYCSKVCGQKDFLNVFERSLLCLLRLHLFD